MAADQPCILLVEDEHAQREVLAYNLEAEGFRVVSAENGEEALLLVDENLPDIIVLDWMMPSLSGIEVCRRLKMRPETRSIPIIMLSARSEEVDKVRGLETGADDYVVKPYSVVELMARVRTQLRRVRPSTVGLRLEFDDIILDSETHKVSRDNKPLKLGPTEFRHRGLAPETALHVVPHRMPNDFVLGDERILDREFRRNRRRRTKSFRKPRVCRLREARTDRRRDQGHGDDQTKARTAKPLHNPIGIGSSSHEVFLQTTAIRQGENTVPVRFLPNGTDKRYSTDLRITTARNQPNRGREPD